MSEAMHETDAGEFSQQIAKTLAGMRSELGCIREDLVKLGHRLPAAASPVVGVQQRCMTLATLVTQIETIAKAKTCAGELKQLPRQERAEDYELFAGCVPLSLDDQRKGLDRRILQTLHRAGDHTLDPDGKESA